MQFAKTQTKTNKNMHTYWSIIVNNTYDRPQHKNKIQFQIKYITDLQLIYEYYNLNCSNIQKDKKTKTQI